jgi:hypothetical protein
MPRSRNDRAVIGAAADFGFIEDVRAIAPRTRTPRQVLLFR